MSTPDIDRVETARRLEQQLNERYGVVLNIDNLAEVFHRTPGGLRWTLAQDNEFSRAINASRIRIGRRTYFRATDVAALLAGGI
ncbi:hypothetical protein D9M71_98660 [compost metagenome]